jgi:acetolactate synthase-1/2/3 large subunit
MKASDYIAGYLAQRGVKHIFAISGAGNVHLLDSIAKNKDLVYVCPHHEQAGVMAANAYGRVSGKMGVMLTTSGGGASNAITGVLDAWADSMPCLIISGQEKTSYARKDNLLRMWGIQGFNIAEMVKGICKYAVMIDNSNSIRFHLDKAFYLANNGRPGPVWLDIPVDIQASQIDVSSLTGYSPEKYADTDLNKQIKKIIPLIRKAKRPVFLLGHGIRLSGGCDSIPLLMKKFPFPFLTSWAATDMVPTNHLQHFGREGVYGQRCANFIIQNCDLLVSIGSRLAIPQVGYSFKEFARAAKKIMVDIDPLELDKFGKQDSLLRIHADARGFIKKLLSNAEKVSFKPPKEWIDKCREWRERYPAVDRSIHCDKQGYINSYNFINQLSNHFSPKEIIVTDMGTALTCTHQAIVLTGKQRLITSQGLGEMGYGLPGAIGACFANNKKRVVLITGDGSMMMNLQELQTIFHHKLPIKIFIYVNDGYLTIKNTQLGIFGKRFTASGKYSGVSCPNFADIGKVFGFKVFKIKKVDIIDSTIERVLKTNGPVICEIVMDPLQALVPKLSFSVKQDGSMVSPPIEDLYPFLPRHELKRQMIIGVHEKSLEIDSLSRKKLKSVRNQERN